MGRLEKSVIRGKTWEPFGTPEDSGELCVWKIRIIGNSGASGNLVATGASLYVAEVRDAVGANARSADELGS